MKACTHGGVWAPQGGAATLGRRLPAGKLLGSGTRPVPSLFACSDSAEREGSWACPHEWCCSPEGAPLGQGQSCW